MEFQLSYFKSWEMMLWKCCTQYAPRFGKLSLRRTQTHIFLTYPILRHLLYESESHSFVSNSLGPSGLYSSWNSPGQNTGVGSPSLLQGIIPTQGLNPGLPHCRQILYQLSHKGSPRILEWVAYPFSRGYSWPRNWTRVSFIAGRFFTNWAIREALSHT